MVFGSFIPKRGDSKRRPTPQPSSPDSEATAVNPPWQSMLQQHLTAQLPEPPPPTAVEPRPTQAHDDIRHQPASAPVPQRPFPKFDNVEEYNRFMREHAPKTYHRPHYPQTPPARTNNPTPPANNPTDMTQVMGQAAYIESQQPIELRRILQYRNENGGKLIVVGYQVISANQTGVTIVPNGYGQTKYQVIPWHRVWELEYAPGDPIGTYK